MRIRKEEKKKKAKIQKKKKYSRFKQNKFKMIWISGNQCFVCTQVFLKLLCDNVYSGELTSSQQCPLNTKRRITTQTIVYTSYVARRGQRSLSSQLARKLDAINPCHTEPVPIPMETLVDHLRIVGDNNHHKLQNQKCTHDTQNRSHSPYIQTSLSKSCRSPYLSQSLS